MPSKIMAIENSTNQSTKTTLILVNLDSKSRKGNKNLMKPTVVYNEIFLEK